MDGLQDLFEKLNLTLLLKQLQRKKKLSRQHSHNIRSIIIRLDPWNEK